jgi:hypothetical protein
MKTLKSSTIIGLRTCICILLCAICFSTFSQSSDLSDVNSKLILLRNTSRTTDFTVIRYFLITVNYLDSSNNNFGHAYFTMNSNLFPSIKWINKFCKEKYGAKSVVILNIMEFKNKADWEQFNNDNE